MRTHPWQRQKTTASQKAPTTLKYKSRSPDNKSLPLSPSLDFNADAQDELDSTTTCDVTVHPLPFRLSILHHKATTITSYPILSTTIDSSARALLHHHHRLADTPAVQCCTLSRTQHTTYHRPQACLRPRIETTRPRALPETRNEAMYHKVPNTKAASFPITCLTGDSQFSTPQEV